MIIVIASVLPIAIYDFENNLYTYQVPSELLDSKSNNHSPFFEPQRNQISPMAFANSTVRLI
jgi:cytochrome c-type biogenesis protein CcmE